MGQRPLEGGSTGSLLGTLTVCAGLTQTPSLDRCVVALETQCAPQHLDRPKPSIVGKLHSEDRSGAPTRTSVRQFEAVLRGKLYIGDSITVPGFIAVPPSVPVRTCAASDGAALPHATQESWRTKAKCCTRLRELGLDLRATTARRIRGAGIVEGTKPYPPTSELARSAAFNASLPCGTITPFVVQIFSMTRSMK